MRAEDFVARRQAFEQALAALREVGITPEQLHAYAFAADLDEVAANFNEGYPPEGEDEPMTALSQATNWDAGDVGEDFMEIVCEMASTFFTPV